MTQALYAHINNKTIKIKKKKKRSSAEKAIMPGHVLHVRSPFGKH
jgi:hypothetical protein